MNLLLFRILQLLSFFGCIFGDDVTKMFKTVLTDCKLSGNRLLETTSPSLSFCCLHCIKKDKRCLSVSYRWSDETCVAHDVCPSDCNSFGIQESGWSLLCNVTDAAVGDCVGGPGGEPFTEVGIHGGQPITAISLMCEDKVAAIQVKYGSSWGPEHGNQNNTEINFDSDEYIVSVSSSLSNIDTVGSVQISTNKNSYGICGTFDPGSEKTSSGSRLLYISGRMGGVVDKLCFHWE